MADDKKKKKTPPPMNPLLVPPPTTVPQPVTPTEPQIPLVPGIPTITGASRRGATQLGVPLSGGSSTVKDPRSQDEVNAPVGHPRMGAAIDTSPAGLQAELRRRLEAVRHSRDVGGENEITQTAAGIMLAGVMDSQTGTMFTAGNRSEVPNVLHPLMKARMEAQRKDVRHLPEAR